MFKNPFYVPGLSLPDMLPDGFPIPGACSNEPYQEKEVLCRKLRSLFSLPIALTETAVIVRLAGHAGSTLQASRHEIEVTRHAVGGEGASSVLDLHPADAHSTMAHSCMHAVRSIWMGHAAH